ncbi:MAG: TolC family protein [Gemmatimonadetes bacterium]|nr:TolC family protein [Gemmatimonadota bacterium]
MSPTLPMPFRPTRLLVLSGALWALGGCSFAPAPAAPEPLERLPEAFAEAESPGAYTPLRWWEGYGDPTLDRLIDTVLAANLDLVEAMSRVEESRALAGIATADLLPSLNGSASAGRSSNPNNAGFGRQIAALLGGASGDSTGAMPDSAAAAPPDRFESTDYSASLALSYELDFWGRARNDREAALRDLQASESDLQSAVLGVLAETITAYFDLSDLRQRIEVSREIVDVLRERAALTQTRYDRGLVGSFELYQIRQDLRNTEAALPQIEALLHDARGRLAVLAGRYPTELAPLLAETRLPSDPFADLPSSIPADLLWQRPDVRAAGLRLESARFRVGARRAELLPRLSLTGTLGLQSAEADGLFDLSQWFSNLTTGLTAPLFQGGRLRANVRAQEARWVQQSAAYGRTVLTAVAEVEAALARHRLERERFAFLTSQLDEASASVDLQSRRYSSGVAGYADYLDALRTRLTVQSTLSAASRDYALSRLGVHRALGGSWLDGAAVPPAPPTASDGPAGGLDASDSSDAPAGALDASNHSDAPEGSFLP